MSEPESILMSAHPHPAYGARPHSKVYPRRRRIMETVAGFGFISPGLIALMLFVFLPAGYVLYLSFVHWNLIDPTPHLVGLRNYERLFIDPEFLQSIRNTLYFGLGLLFLLLPLGLLLAVLLDIGLRGSKVYRTIVFAPYVVPLVASGLAWALLDNRDYGLTDQALRMIHITGPDWLGNPSLALPSVLVMTIWQYMGYYMLIFLAGLQNVASSLKEAAAVDGAGLWQTFWSVTLPSLRPSLFFAFVIASIQAFQTFDQVYVMTAGGPAGATTTLVYYIYNQGFQMYNIGTAAAASMVLLVLLALLTWLQVWMGRKWMGDE